YHISISHYTYRSASVPYAHTSPAEIHTPSLHDALPIYDTSQEVSKPIKHSDRDPSFDKAEKASSRISDDAQLEEIPFEPLVEETDRKSTRLNSSHVSISYAVFCLKKKRIKILFYPHLFL